MYFLIHNSDGETHVEQVDPGKLAREISEGDYEGSNFLKKLPINGDTNAWPVNSYLLIKGEVIVPRTVEVVTRVEID
jgi:hypothetical protein